MYSITVAGFSFSLLYAAAPLLFIIVLIFGLLRKKKKNNSVVNVLIKACAAGIVGFALAFAFNFYKSNQAPPLPTISLNRFDGSSVTLREIANGKPMVVNLWASWCAPCVKEMPVLAQAEENFENLTFIFVNQGENREEMDEFMRNQKLRLKNVLVDHGGRLGRELKAQGLPITLIYDAQGTPIAAHTGELSQEKLEKMIAKLGN